jgi:hypothetical protein
MMTSIMIHDPKDDVGINDTMVERHNFDDSDEYSDEAQQDDDVAKDDSSVLSNAADKQPNSSIPE